MIVEVCRLEGTEDGDVIARKLVYEVETEPEGQTEDDN